MRIALIVLLFAYIVLSALPPAFAAIFQFTDWRPRGADPAQVALFLSYGEWRFALLAAPPVIYAMALAGLIARRGFAIPALVGGLLVDLARRATDVFFSPAYAAAVTPRERVADLAVLLAPLLIAYMMVALRRRGVLT